MDQLRTARRLRAFGFALCAALLPALAAAQAWPSKPVKIIVGYPPGGGTNTVARLLAEHLSKSLGQQVVVENRPGAGGRIATLPARPLQWSKGCMRRWSRPSSRRSSAGHSRT